MPSLTMRRAPPKLPGVLAHSSGSAGAPKTDPQFCFSCEKVFPSQGRLEEHTCPAASHICSCGTEFPLYVDMLLHSTTHEPGHQVLYQRIIKKRRFEKYQEVEEKMRRLESVRHGVTNAPKASSDMNVNSHTHIASPVLQHVPKQSADISKLSGLLPNPAKSTAGVRDGRVAPTVDLWTLYHPVVLVKAKSKTVLPRPYSCGKCGECFATKKSLVAHHSLHGVDKVAGCVGCGLLLSSRKMVPRLHQCNVLSSSPKLRLITASPPVPRGNRTKAGTNTHGSVSVLGSQRVGWGGHVSPSSDMSATIRSAPDRSIQRLNFSSVQQLKSLSPPGKSNQGFLTGASPQWKRPYPSPFAKKDPALHIGSPQQVKKSAISAPDPCSNRAQEAAGTNRLTCRVCHISFLSSQLLQRHKCVKAQEFMVKHRQASRQANRYRKAVPESSLNIHFNGQRKLGGLASGNIKINQVVGAVADRENGALNNINGKPGADLDDDDCFIVESNPAKPAEMIYQVTSSLPVKT